MSMMILLFHFNLYTYTIIYSYTYNGKMNLSFNMNIINTIRFSVSQSLLLDCNYHYDNLGKIRVAVALEKLG